MPTYNDSKLFNPTLSRLRLAYLKYLIPLTIVLTHINHDTLPSLVVVRGTSHVCNSDVCLGHILSCARN